MFADGWPVSSLESQETPQADAVCFVPDGIRKRRQIPNPFKLVYKSLHVIQRCLNCVFTPSVQVKVSVHILGLGQVPSKLVENAKLQSYMLSDVKDVRVPVMNPTALFSDCFQCVGCCAPHLLRRLESVAFRQLYSGVFQKPAAHLSVAFHAQLAGFGEWSRHDASRARLLAWVVGVVPRTGHPGAHARGQLGQRALIQRNGAGEGRVLAL